jgi:hypothetical protein
VQARTCLEITRAKLEGWLPLGELPCQAEPRPLLPNAWREQARRLLRWRVRLGSIHSAIQAAAYRRSPTVPVFLAADIPTIASARSFGVRPLARPSSCGILIAGWTSTRCDRYHGMGETYVERGAKGGGEGRGSSRPCSVLLCRLSFGYSPEPASYA